MSALRQSSRGLSLALSLLLVVAYQLSSSFCPLAAVLAAPLGSFAVLARGPDAVDEETPDEELDVHFVRNYTREELDHNTKAVEEASKADKPHKVVGAKGPTKP